MVRGGQNAHHHSDESDSDWDSLAQPPAVQPPPIQQQAKEVVISPLKLRDAAAVAGSRTTVDRQGSADDESGVRSISGTSVKAGPLTFIDRRSSTSTNNKSLPVVLRLPESVDEDLPAPMVGDDATDVDEIEFQHENHSPVSKNDPRPNARADVRKSQSPSTDGFDNAAFEGSSGKYTPSARLEDVKMEKRTPVHQPHFPRADETIEIFAYEKLQPEFHKTSEKKRRKAAAERFNETIFEASTRFWAEVTAVVGLPFVFLLAFLIQFLRFLTVGLLRPLLIGLIDGLSDGLLKPLLAGLHNALVNPCATFLHNLATAITSILSPLTGVVQIVTEPLGRLFQSCRLIEIHHHHNQQPHKSIHNI